MTRGHLFVPVMRRRALEAAQRNPPPGPPPKSAWEPHAIMTPESCKYMRERGHHYGQDRCAWPRGRPLTWWERFTWPGVGKVWCVGKDGRGAMM
jgi:hypothetical protein